MFQPFPVFPLIFSPVEIVAQVPPTIEADFSHSYRPTALFTRNTLHRRRRIIIVIVILLEALCGYLVQSKDGLIRILYEHEFALFAFEAHVGNGADDAPSVGERQVHLVGEVAGLPSNNAEDDVFVVGAGSHSRDEPESTG